MLQKAWGFERLDQDTSFASLKALESEIQCYMQS